MRTIFCAKNKRETRFKRKEARRTFTGSNPFHVKGPAFQLNTGFKLSSICTSRHDGKAAECAHWETKGSTHTTGLVWGRLLEPTQRTTYGSLQWHEQRRKRMLHRRRQTGRQPERQHVLVDEVLAAQHGDLLTTRSMSDARGCAPLCTHPENPDVTNFAGAYPPGVRCDRHDGRGARREVGGWVERLRRHVSCAGSWGLRQQPTVRGYRLCLCT